ncbi:MAG: hypothetical protein QOG65_3142, partial [Actinomycetota bacterium]|nr:hypothetical protein [Actinomycetota bacterium]
MNERRLFAEARAIASPVGRFRGLALSGAVIAAMAAAPSVAEADVVGTVFESSTYHTGNIDGQGDWSKTGPYDVNVVNVNAFPDAAGYGFGSKSMQSSNAVVSGSFGDQTFTPSTVDEAGETGASGNGYSGGIRQTQYKARFRIGTALSTEQSGLYMSVSPDRGDGARMSYLRFEDHPDGVHVFFDEFVLNDFTDDDIATLPRNASHLIEFQIDFVDGAGNDQVTIKIDGSTVKTGTTWEDYFRDVDPMAPVPTVDSLLFREGGGAGDERPAHSGKGFLIDDVRIETTTPGANVGPTGATGA